MRIDRLRGSPVKGLERAEVDAPGLLPEWVRAGVEAGAG